MKNRFFILPLFLAAMLLALTAPAQALRGPFDTSKLYFATNGGSFTNYYWADTAYTNSSNHGWMRTNTTTHRWEYLVSTTLLATNGTATNVWRGTNGISVYTSYWASASSPSGSVPGISTNQSNSGNTNPPAVAAAPVVNYAGTNAPEGIYTAGYGSIYNQFDPSAPTNLIQGWVKSTTTGSTGWRTNLGVAANPRMATTVLFPSGTNDQSAVIQAAFSQTNAVVWFTAGNYYATNLWLTSNVTIYGNGARLVQLANASQNRWSTNNDWTFASVNIGVNALINCGTNIGQRIYNLVLDGNRPSAYYSSSLNPYQGVNGGLYGMQLCFTNNHGLAWNAAGGGEVSGCTAQNFAGSGFFVYSSSDQLGYQSKLGSFHNNLAATNYLGIYFQSWGGSVPNTYGNAEYVLLSECVANNCTIGVDNGASNARMSDLTLNNNRLALNIQGGNGNAGPHTRSHHINLNHNDYGFRIGYCDGYEMDGVFEVVTTSNIVKNASVNFNNCVLSPIWVDGQGSQYSNFKLVAFKNCWLDYVNATSNNIAIENSQFASSVAVNGCTNTVYNSWTTRAFTNWLGDVIVNAGGAAYFGAGNHVFNGQLIDDGTIYIEQPADGYNISGATYTNSALTYTLIPGVWSFNFYAFFSADTGGGGYTWVKWVFSSNVALRGYEQFEDYGVQGGGAVGHILVYPQNASATTEGAAGSGSFFHFTGNGCFSNSVPVTMTLQFRNQSSGTNHIWAGSNLRIKKLK